MWAAVLDVDDHRPGYRVPVREIHIRRGLDLDDSQIARSERHAGVRRRWRIFHVTDAVAGDALKCVCLTTGAHECPARRGRVAEPCREGTAVLRDEDREILDAAAGVGAGPRNWQTA